MSYGRNPYYIYTDGEYMVFDGIIRVPEEMINALLYKLLLKNRREELKERLIEGKQEWLYQDKLIDKTTRKEPDWNNCNGESFEIIKVPTDESYVRWMEDNEDEIVKRLMGEDS